MARKRKPGGGRKKSKPDYNPSAILQNQMDAAVALYSTADHPSLQTIANELDINPIKARKLLITAGVYKSEIAEQVNVTKPVLYYYFKNKEDAIKARIEGEKKYWDPLL